MAVLALGLAGAAVGGALVPGAIAFGITGASAGWMIGTTLGSMLGPGTHVEGPRVGDRPVTSSTLGTPMAIIYGTDRATGNVIDCSKIRESSTTQSTGKGGPKQTTTTYTYDCDIAIDLCRGTMAGIRKMYMDGKLVYDVSTAGQSVDSVIASSVHAKGFTFYPGDELQMPDPTLEALNGVGRVSAYRGRCYVVFQQLDCPNARIPQLSFEVVQTANPGGAASIIYDTTEVPVGGIFEPTATVIKEAAVQFQKGGEPTTYFLIGNNFTNGPRPLDFVPSGVTIASSFSPTPVQGAKYWMRATFQNAAYSFPMDISVGSFDTGVINVLSEYIPGSSDNALRPLYAARDPISGIFCAVSAPGTSRGSHITILTGDLGNGGILTEALNVDGQPMSFYNNVVYTSAEFGGFLQLDTYDLTGTRTASYVGPASAIALHLTHVDENGVYVIEMDAHAVGTARKVFKVDLATNTWTVLTSTAHFDNLAAGVKTFYCCDTYALVGPCKNPVGTLWDYILIPFASMDGVDVTVASIIQDQAQGAGMDLSQIDVTGVPDTVHGYPLYRVSSARANIEPLLKAFFLDCCDVDGKLVFRKRASQPVTDLIPFDDLGAVDNGNVPGDPFPLVRTQESDLPRSLTVSFLDINADYQPGAEQGLRQVTRSLVDLHEDIAICSDGTKMKQVAEVRLFDMWTARNGRTTKLTRKYAWLCAGDVVPIEYPRGTIGQWLLTGVDDTGVLLSVTAVEANASLYTSAATGATVDQSQTVDPLLSPTHLLFADVPLLRDQDDYPGAYVALAGYGAVFPGSTLYVGLGDSSLVAQGSVNASSPIGFTENALGAWTTGEMDEANVLTVNMGPDALTSSTRDAVVDGTVNLCLVGAQGRWEVMQFIRAVSLGGNRFTLSGFKRGLLGTEQYRGTHTTVDSFCLLQAVGVLKPHFQIVDINTQKDYRAVTLGAALDSGISSPNTDTGVCLKPRSPVNVRKVTNADGTFTFTWDRRTRYAQNWLLGVVPLGETSESYDVELRNGLGVVTASATVSTASWSNATAPTGTFTVYQKSSAIGRGYPASIAI